jgi:hypothetical protein
MKLEHVPWRAVGQGAVGLVPDIFRWIEFRGVGRERFHMQSWMASDPLRDLAAARWMVPRSQSKTTGPRRCRSRCVSLDHGPVRREPPTRLLVGRLELTRFLSRTRSRRSLTRSSSQSRRAPRGSRRASSSVVTPMYAGRILRGTAPEAASACVIIAQYRGSLPLWQAPVSRRLQSSPARGVMVCRTQDPPGQGRISVG